MTDAPWRLDAAALHDAYAARRLSPVEALEFVLSRIDQCEPALNAMAWLDRAGARQAAQASARRWQAGAPLGPLDGVPVGVKDNLHAAGQPTGWGTALQSGFIAARDERPVARLRAAGAVLFGKSCVPEFAMQGTTANLVTGVTRNPWNPALTPGGSSGGAAAGVAAGYGPLALGTDGGGSIRRPASHCGLVGLKPSAGLVPRGEGLPEIFLGYEVAGAIGRSVADVRAMTEVLAGTALRQPPRPLRLLFVPRFGDNPVDPGIAEAVAQAAARFAALGHGVTEAARFELAEPVNAAWSTLSSAGLAWLFQDPARWPELRGEPDPARCGAAAQASLNQGRAVEGTGLFGLLMQVHRLQRQLADLFARHDAILTPATAALPWPAADTHPATIDGQPVGPRGHAVFTAIGNAAGLPGLAVPTGFVHGLPTGVQLLGPPGADATLLAAAEQYLRAHPRTEWPPGL